jgi:hypothetical protein
LQYLLPRWQRGLHLPLGQGVYSASSYFSCSFSFYHCQSRVGVHTKLELIPLPPPAPSKTSTGVTLPPPTPAGSRAKTPARLPSSPPSRSKIKAMLARAAKARGSGKSAQKKAAPPANKDFSCSSSSYSSFSKDQVRTSEEEAAAPISAPAADVPSGSGSRGATFDEVVSRFAASCPGGGLMNMAKLPTDILVAKGASVLAEVNFYFFLLFLSFFWQKLTFSSFCRASSLPWPWRSSC